MTKRIPHIEDAISSAEAVSSYIEGHDENHSAHYFGFFKELEKLSIQGRLLEIGSGPGILTALMAKLYPHVEILALEPSSDMIDFATDYCEEAGLSNRVSFVQGSIDDRRNLKELGQFDLVYSTFSLHHWKHPQEAWRAMYSFVKENGRLLIHDLKRVPWLYHLPFQGGFFESIRAAYLPKEIEFMLSYANINDYRIKTPFPFFWMSVIANKPNKAA